MPKTRLSVAALLLLAAAPAAARPGAPPSVHVRHSDLNLTTAAGLAALDRRIQRAVEAACGLAGATDLRSRLLAARCRESAVPSAAAQRAAVLAKASQVRLAKAG